MGNLAMRSIVWLAALAWWTYLKKPAGAALTDIRHGLGGVAGLSLLVVGGLSALWSMLTLDADKRAPGAPPGDLRTKGPYHYVRNPLYLSGAAMFAAISTMYVPWTLAAAARFAVLLVIVHIVVVRLEEPATRRRFGPDYEDYCRRVPRWIPRLGGKS